jgi:outer membrane protein TolC
MKFFIFLFLFFYKVEALTLKDYKEEVRRSDQGLFLEKTQEAARGQGVMSAQLYAPILLGSMQKNETTKSSQETHALSVQKEFFWGIQGTVGGQLKEGAGLTQRGGQISLSIPLRRNALGEETKLKHDEIGLSAQLAEDQIEKQRKLLLAEAEQAYWGVLSAQNVYRAQENCYEALLELLRAQKEKLANNLIDPEDLWAIEASALMMETQKSQAEAAYEYSLRNLNVLRQQPPLQDPGSLVVPDNLNDFILEKPKSFRDLEQAKREYEASRIKNQLLEESQKSQWTLTGLYQKMPSSAPSSWEVKLSWAVPLLDASLREAQTLIPSSSLEAARYKWKQTQEKVPIDWDTLILKLKNTQAHLTLASKALLHQKLRCEKEKIRFTRGVITSPQMFQCRQELLNTELLKQQLTDQILNINVQALLMGGGHEF